MDLRKETAVSDEYLFPSDKFPESENITCDPIPMSMPRAWSDGPVFIFRALEINAMTAMVSVGGLAKLGTWVWNSEGTYSQ
jgi:hypothetical protein